MWKARAVTRNPWQRSRWRQDITTMRQIERSIGGGRGGTRKGEPSMNLCGGPPGSTRALSPRQLPTDHDYAVPTREYQSDQPSRQPTRPPPMPRAFERHDEGKTERADEQNSGVTNELI